VTGFLSLMYFKPELLICQKLSGCNCSVRNILELDGRPCSR
jgi:hypothetical protein